MGNINTSFTERVRYTLFHKESGSLILKNDPQGWNEDQKEITRNKDYHGIFASFSNNLRFVGDAKDFIESVYDVYGINADIRLKKEILHPKTDLWVDDYSGYLDLSTREVQDNKLSCKFNSGGLEQILKARESEQLELDRETTLDGVVIEPLQPKELTLEGRRIFLKSRWETKIGNNTAYMSNESNDGNVRNQTCGIPMELVSQSHEEAQSSSPTNGTRDNGTAGMFFISNSEVDRTFRLKFSLSFKVQNIDQNEMSYAYFQVALSTYGVDPYDTIKRIDLLNIETDGRVFRANVYKTYTIDFDEEIKLLQGQSLSLEFYQYVDFRVSNQARLRFSLSNITCKLSIDENSYFEPTKAKFILVHDLFSRISELITNRKNNFHSKYFGRKDLGYSKDGPGAFFGLTHGFWVRGFDKLPLSTEENPNLFKPMTTSFRDAFDSFSAICNAGLGIERIGFSERIIIEDLKYFYNRNVTIRLPNQVKNVKRSIATEYYYSSIELGYSNGGAYEEAQGLDEYNGKATFTTVITRIKQTYTKVSSYIAASYAKEFTRRKPFFRYPDLDTQRDSEIFVMDLKKTPIGTYVERKWQDDFQKEPTGVFSPETATNLRLSPFNLLLKHGWVIASGLTKYATDYVRYGSSTGNPKLKTKLRTDNDYLNDTSSTPGNGNEYSDDDKIINSELERARYVPEYVEFEHIVNYEIMQQIQGYTIVSGEKIYNVYGLVEFINENSEKEKGFLISVKPNGNGQFKLLTFNR